MDILFEKALGKLKSLLGIEAVASSDRSCSSSDSGWKVEGYSVRY
jgi:hypothetical protein